MTWVVSVNEYEGYSGDFETLDEAIEGAREELQLEPGDRFYVARRVEYTPVVDVDDFIESMQSHALNEISEAEGWLTSTSARERNRLADMLDDAFRRWMESTGNLPDFFLVEEATRHVAAEDDENEDEDEDEDEDQLPLLEQEIGIGEIE